MPRTLKNDVWIFLLVERHLTQFVRVLPYEIILFLMNFIFSPRNKKISCGKKHTVLFQTHNWEKSSFFSRLIRVFSRLYPNTWQGGHNVPPAGPNRVSVGFHLQIIIISAFVDCSCSIPLSNTCVASKFELQPKTQNIGKSLKSLPPRFSLEHESCHYWNRHWNLFRKQQRM